MEINLTPLYGFNYIQNQNHGFQFALLSNDNQILHSPFQCKDYVQDIFWTEYTGNESSIYGIRWKKGMLDIEQDFFKVVVMGGKENMNDKIEGMLSIINQFEDALKIPLCKIHKTNSVHNIVVEFSKGWTKSAPLLSSFLSLIRISGDYNTEETPQSYLQRLFNFYVKDQYFAQSIECPFPRYMTPDIQRLKITLKRYAALLEGKYPDVDWSSFSSVQIVHNLSGILSYKDFPEVEV